MLVGPDEPETKWESNIVKELKADIINPVGVIRF
jgi:hypothetical protein